MLYYLWPVASSDRHSHPHPGCLFFFVGVSLCSLMFHEVSCSAATLRLLPFDYIACFFIYFALSLSLSLFSAARLMLLYCLLLLYCYLPPLPLSYRYYIPRFVCCFDNFRLISIVHYSPPSLRRPLSLIIFLFFSLFCFPLPNVCFI